MAVVVFSSELQKLTGEAETRSDKIIYRDIVADIAARYPRLDADRLLEMAVAIDGEIVHTPLLERIEQDSEVHFLYRISGG